MGQSQILPYIIQLSEIGYSFGIISFEKDELYTKNRKFIISLIKDLPINWIPLKYHKRPPVFSTILDVYSLKKNVRNYIRKTQPSIIHCRSYLPSIIAVKQCKKNNIKFLFDMRGFYADERVEGEIWKLNNPIYKWIYNYFKKKEKLFLKEANHIISLTDSGKNIILDWKIKNVSDKKITVIPCCSDFNHFNIPEKKIRTESRSFLKIDSETIVLGYLGSLGSWYLVNEMIKFYKLLKENYQNSKFLLISHQEISSYYNVFTKFGLTINDFITLSSSRQNIPYYLASVDIGISFIKPSFSKKASSPTKVGEMLAMGIPMIVNKQVGDIDKIFSENKFGALLDTKDINSMNSAVNKIPFLLSLDKEKIREEAFKILDLNNVGVYNYEKVYDSLNTIKK